MPQLLNFVHSVFNFTLDVIRKNVTAGSNKISVSSVLAFIL